MNLEKFETQYNLALHQSLEQLQTVVLLLSQLQSQTPETLLPQLEVKIVNIGQDLQYIGQSVEEWIIQEKAKSI